MASNETIRGYQRALALHVVRHAKANLRLEKTIARRAEVVAAQDLEVNAARIGLEQATIEMAQALGPELTSTVVGVELTEVRRLVRNAGRLASSSDARSG